MRIRQVPLVVARHPSGGWRIELAEGGVGPRSHSVTTAILMEASELFVEDAGEATEKRAA